MKHYSTLFGLPPSSLNLLSGGFVIFAICVGIRIVKAPNLALKVANTSLITSSSASRLELQAKRLEQQAKVIQQKEEAYQSLKQIYDSYLLNQKGDIELGIAIEAINDLPQVENIEEIKQEIEETESNLSSVINE